ncbi:MAG: hypothetical protein H6713_12530 [Myxococcales bacterium]|nr:hypothetical protein [Myxococcales bacterium]
MSSLLAAALIGALSVSPGLPASPPPAPTPRAPGPTPIGPSPADTPSVAPAPATASPNATSLAPPAPEPSSSRATWRRTKNGKDLKAPELLTSDRWCADPLTLCWDKSATRPTGSGFRLLLEPRLDFVAQLGRTIDDASLKLHVVVGVEMNLAWGWLAMQGTYIAPYTAQVTGFKTDDAGDILNWSVDANVVSGFGAGVSLFNGVLALGYGRVFYNGDQIRALHTADNDFSCLEDQCGRKDYGDGFFYVALQPVSAIRAALTAAKERAPSS